MSLVFHAQLRPHMRHGTTGSLQVLLDRTLELLFSLERRLCLPVAVSACTYSFSMKPGGAVILTGSSRVNDV